ncbi:cyclic nucleotide-binding protein [Clostridium sp. CAG:1013]|nr:cyclic nucleotide-binding protein [Clostridium sp. CAG:1013]
MVSQETFFQTLQNSILFQDMCQSEIETVLGKLQSYRKIFPKHAMVIQDGECLPQVGLILEGNLHLFHVDAKGNKNLMDCLGAGETLGLLNAIGGYRLHVSAEATENTELFFFSVDDLLRGNKVTLPPQIHFLQNLALATAQQAYRLTKKLEDSIRHSTREHLQDYLSEEFHKTGKRIFTIPLNRQDLADFLFVDRSAMSNELCKMREEGLIKFEKSRFELLIEMPITDAEQDPNSAMNKRKK